MSLRRLLPILMLALLLAPFGRVAAVEAKAMPQHPSMQTGGHCAGQPQPANAPAHERMGIDCMIACAAMAPAPDPFVVPPVAAVERPTPLPAAHHSGIRPEAEPPPPRLA